MREKFLMQDSHFAGGCGFIIKNVSKFSFVQFSFLNPLNFIGGMPCAT